jgi:hypothetical protein
MVEWANKKRSGNPLYGGNLQEFKESGDKVDENNVSFGIES